MKSDRIADSYEPLGTIRLPMQSRFLGRSQLLIYV